ncbi:SagB/ThcOx family dehydrogenase [Noviherbaspirillum sp.]|uniref:SagB/ThcOx family dehydrogenase n=1 Tax=Noviherbaspirillum sp. TaxID=1926288 RepID=UPI002B48E7D5|nr:SagB/ThcOx family dehydrogenase [Noviherbaspirillum sp.]HJV79655.1 SagB/ThcOx family dehydrogenase [Noviherbaspirillum sp.]
MPPRLIRILLPLLMRIASAGAAFLPLALDAAAVPYDEAKAASVDAVIRYHELSSGSRNSVTRPAPAVDWGAVPPPFKAYPGVAHVALERRAAGARGLSDALRSPALHRQRLRRDELGEMLYLSAGVTGRREGNALRAAPSAGALYPIELYLVARAVDGLPAGLYHYDPEHHRLDALGAAPARFGAPEAEGADAVALLSAVFRRTGNKYRDRAYRLAVADAGHLMENLRLAAHQTGMQARPLAQFDDALVARALGIDGVEEGVLAVMQMRHATDAPAAGTRSPAHFVPAPMPQGTALGITGMAQEATSLRLVPEEKQAGAIALPPPLPATQDLREVIVGRRSTRRFLADPVPLAMLSSMLADMALPPLLSDAINIHLVVNRVAGLPAGVYRYVPGHALVPVRQGDFAAAAQSAALSQPVIGNAAVVLVLSADRERMLAQGARGYRHAYLEAGMLGERWLLGAVARGLAACPVGAFYDDEAAALIAVDAQREWVLHFATLGKAEK